MAAALSSGIINNISKIITLNTTNNNHIESLELMENIFKTEIYSEKYSHIDQQFLMPALTLKKSSECISPQFVNSDRYANYRRSSSMFKFMSRINHYYSKKKYKINSVDLDFSLSIDSKFVDHALSTVEHRRIFLILLFIAKSVCFHSLLPDQKINIAKLIKHNFVFNPIVLAVENEGISSGVL